MNFALAVSFLFIIAFLAFNVSATAITCNMQIAAAGSYTLSGNIQCNDTVVTINDGVENVSIIGNNFALIGNLTTGSYGIAINSTENNTVRNITITNISFYDFDVAILSVGGSDKINWSIGNITINNSLTYAINLVNVTSLNIDNITIQDSTASTAINLTGEYSEGNITITRSKIKNISGDFVNILDINYIRIENNTFNNTALAGILLKDINSGLIRSNQLGNVTTGLTFTTNVKNIIARYNVLNKIGTYNFDIQASSNNTQFFDNTLNTLIGGRITGVVFNTQFNTTAGYYFNITESLGTLIINQSTNFASIKSTATGLNNVTFMRLTNALLHNSTRIGGSGNISANDGTISINDIARDGNTWYVLNNYQLQEGIAWVNSPFWFHSSSTSAKSMASNLSDMVNVTVLSDVGNCSNIQAITITPNYTETPVTLGVDRYTCSASVLTTYETIFTKGIGGNRIAIVYHTSVETGFLEICNNFENMPLNFSQRLVIIGSIFGVIFILGLIGVVILYAQRLNGGDTSMIESINPANMAWMIGTVIVGVLIFVIVIFSILYGTDVICAIDMA